MPTTVNKLIGTLKLGDTSTGVAMEAQVTQVGLPQTVTRDSPVVVLTGDLIQAQAIYSNSVQGTLLIDWTDPDGVVYFVQSNKGPADAVYVPARRCGRAHLHRHAHQ